MSSDRFTPPWHLLAVEYMRVFPGTPYARACDIVKGESGADPWATPWYHAQAVAYMMDHPGMEYSAAVEQATAGVLPAPAPVTRPGPRPNPMLPAGDPPEDDPFAEPPGHAAATTYMLANPGTSYEEAVQYVRGRR